MTSKNLPGSGSTDHERPTSTAEKEEFSSGGNRHMIILRGKTGLAIDTFVLWLTGYSLMTKQYALANGTGYQPTLLLYTKARKLGRSDAAGFPTSWLTVVMSCEEAMVVGRRIRIGVIMCAAIQRQRFE